MCTKKNLYRWHRKSKVNITDENGNTVGTMSAVQHIEKPSYQGVQIATAGVTFTIANDKVLLKLLAWCLRVVDHLLFFVCETLKRFSLETFQENFWTAMPIPAQRCLWAEMSTRSASRSKSTFSVHPSQAQTGRARETQTKSA